MKNKNNDLVEFTAHCAKLGSVPYLTIMSKTRFDDVYYGLVVDVYDLFHPEGNIADAAFYAELISERSGRVLELMCGSGRVLLPLLRQGVIIRENSFFREKCDNDTDKRVGNQKWRQA